MRIESNIKGVIRQMERLKANIPIAAQRALAPKRWQGVAYGTAERTLTALAREDERQYIPQFMRTFMAMPMEPGLSLRLSRPDREALHAPGEIFGYHKGEKAAWNQPLGHILFDMPIPEFKDLILDWVQTAEEAGGKARDRRDASKTDEEIADTIAQVMLSPNDNAQAARKALLPHILEWMKSQLANDLPPETVSLWLRAVLAAWAEMIRLQFPALLRQELQKMKGEL